MAFSLDELIYPPLPKTPFVTDAPAIRTIEDVVDKMKKHPYKSVLVEADKVINSARPDKYGSVQESFGKIATIFNQILSKEERNGLFTAEMVAKLLVCMKLVRDSYSPDNPDHLLDACGYLGLLDQLRFGE